MTTPSLVPHSIASPEAAAPDLRFVNVFSSGAGGGNPAPVVFDADSLSSDDMMAIAARYGHESAFVCRASDPRNTVRLRFFVPAHEMEMCGHATLGAMWLLREAGRWTTASATVETLSGLVDVRFDEVTQRIDVGQPRGIVEPVDDPARVAAICEVLGIGEDDLAPMGVVNASTSRTKTLVPLRSVERLNTLTPNLSAVAALCDALNSTGLYPFAVERTRPLELHARQFPRSSGYPEDAATGIAAAAMLYGVLHYGLLANGESAIRVYQGFAMGRPSCIRVALREPGNYGSGCWISGAVEFAMLEPHA
ncbi:PhzF family phenazine biosynthesis protein [Pandoraea sputorum]|uniref:PhzF family phenazine biosynthesis protein n=1 Tax=Pandoraea sputorum TaxID=93222 RepID=UPI0012418849|nr:PhzF family phenazine biosynthesis protein [Pandoraea sputorum]VVE75244.1 phenazine biosynthesis protein [Pandoraea sputorum]